MTGKYGNLLKKARGENSEAENKNESASSNTAKQQAGFTAKQESVNTENSSEAETIKEKEVSLTIKVPISWRQHWVAECKREGKNSQRGSYRDASRKIRQAVKLFNRKNQLFLFKY